MLTWGSITLTAVRFCVLIDVVDCVFRFLPLSLASVVEIFLLFKKSMSATSSSNNH